MNKYDQQVSRVLKEGTLNLYANGTTGDDDNDGLTELTPKKSLAAVSALVPDKILNGANCVVHARGTFTGADAEVEFNSTVYDGGMLLIDGGTDFTELVAAATADISSTTTLGLSTLTMTVDQYAGYWLEILDGAAAGQVRTILLHDATTFTVNVAFSVNPGNASYRIVRPTTTLASDATWRYVIPCNTGQGVVALQNFFHTGDRLPVDICNSSRVIVTACVLTGSSSITAGGSAYFNLLERNYVVPWFTTNALLRMGVSVISAANRVRILTCAGATVAGAVILGELDVESSYLNGPSASRMARVTFRGVTSDAGWNFWPSGGVKSYIIGSTGAGLSIIGGRPVIAAGGLEINNCASHAIEVEHGALSIEGALTGTGNGGAGLYAHSGSAVKIAAATSPTVTGTVGDTSTDGTTAASTWAAIAAGTPVTDASEFSLIKAV